MSKISNIEKVQEFTSLDSRITYGTYSVIFNDKQHIFIRNGNSVGTVSYYLDKPASQCISEIRDDVKEEFFQMLEVK